MKRIGLLNGFSADGERYAEALRPISQLDGYEIETIEDFNLTDTFSGAIWGLINICDVLVAFVDGKSESLYYQIGLAHGAGKPVIIVTDHEYVLPPEIRGQRILKTSHRQLNDSNLIFQLREAVEEAVKKKLGYLGPRGELKQYIVSSDDRPNMNFRELFSEERLSRAKYFEQWFSEMAGGIRGWDVIESENSNRRDNGFDLVIWNSLEDSELSVLGNPIAVEIKAIRSMNSSSLHQFLHLSKKSGINGLILATTGRNDKRTRNLLKKFRDSEGINAIALDRDDLVNVRYPSDLLQLVKVKVRELLYGQAT